MYKAAKHMTGRQAMELFKRYGVMDYVLSCYEALHTTGTNYIVEDIDLFVEARAANLPAPLMRKLWERKYVKL
jgi:hypothetical protein